jgi:hypothetical protein
MASAFPSAVEFSAPAAAPLLKLSLTAGFIIRLRSHNSKSMGRGQTLERWRLFTGVCVGVVFDSKKRVGDFVDTACAALVGDE